MALPVDLSSCSQFFLLQADGSMITNKIMQARILNRKRVCAIYKYISHIIYIYGIENRYCSNVGYNCTHQGAVCHTFDINTSSSQKIATSKIPILALQRFTVRLITFVFPNGSHEEQHVPTKACTYDL